MNKKLIYSGFIVPECILWGVGNTITKIGLTSIGPFSCLTVRFFLAWLLFRVFFSHRLDAHKADIKRCLSVSVITAAAFISSTLSLNFASATTAGLLMALSVIFTPFLAFFMHKIPLDKRMLCAVTLVVGGMYLLCGFDVNANYGIGELLALFSSFCLAVTLTFSAVSVQTLDPIVLSATQAGMTATLSLIPALLFERINTLAEIPLSGWLSVIYLAVGCTFVAYLLQNTVLAHVSPVFVSITFCVEPVFTALSAYIILGEQLALIGYIGAFLIMAGILISTLPKKQCDSRL
ncbi:MAG TPA: EamA family transporter [Clostridia bacterium]|nr:EamA family transporter [Clostridia bacterium]